MITIRTRARRCSGRCGDSYPVERLERVGRGLYCASDAKWERRYAAADAERRRSEIVAEVATWAEVAAGRRAYARWSEHAAGAEALAKDPQAAEYLRHALGGESR